MGTQTTFHAPGKGAEFLGWRIGRKGSTEIVYEDGAAHRMVWRVNPGQGSETALAEVMKLAVGAVRVVPTLIVELQKRQIGVERLTL